MRNENLDGLLCLYSVQNIQSTSQLMEHQNNTERQFDLSVLPKWHHSCCLCLNVVVKIWILTLGLFLHMSMGQSVIVNFPLLLSHEHFGMFVMWSRGGQLLSPIAFPNCFWCFGILMMAILWRCYRIMQNLVTPQNVKVQSWSLVSISFCTHHLFFFHVMKWHEITTTIVESLQSSCFSTTRFQ